jgi:type IV secretory pathway VirB2 component (pilin)
MAMTADNQQMTLAATQTMQSTITTLQASKTTLEAEADTLKTDKTVMQTKLDNVQCEPCGNIGDELAIALIVVAGVMLLITSLTLCTLIYKEKKGRAVFVPAVGPQMVVGSPVGSAGEDGKA